MKQVKTLIDTAADRVGSRYRLAKQLDLDQGQLSNIVSGKQPMPPALAARLAEIVGVDPKEAACAALAEQQKDMAKRQELYRLFRLAPAANAAAAMALLIGLTGAPSPTAAAATTGAGPDRLCVMSTRLRRILRRLFSSDQRLVAA